jgi:hypothetical protein
VALSSRGACAPRLHHYHFAANNTRTPSVLSKQLLSVYCRANNHARSVHHGSAHHMCLTYQASMHDRYDRRLCALSQAPIESVCFVALRGSCDGAITSKLYNSVALYSSELCSDMCGILMRHIEHARSDLTRELMHSSKRSTNAAHGSDAIVVDALDASQGLAGHPLAVHTCAAHHPLLPDMILTSVP